MICQLFVLYLLYFAPYVLNAHAQFTRMYNICAVKSELTMQSSINDGSKLKRATKIEVRCQKVLEVSPLCKNKTKKLFSGTISCNVGLLGKLCKL